MTSLNRKAVVPSFLHEPSFGTVTTVWCNRLGPVTPVHDVGSRAGLIDVQSAGHGSALSLEETVAFIVPRERMEALLETMEIMANPAAMRAIRRDQSGKGKYLPLSVLDENEG